MAIATILLQLWCDVTNLMLNSEDIILFRECCQRKEASAFSYVFQTLTSRPRLLGKVGSWVSHSLITIIW
jgi:hypothetical protein